MSDIVFDNLNVKDYEIIEYPNPLIKKIIIHKDIKELLSDDVLLENIFSDIKYLIWNMPRADKINIIKKFLDYEEVTLEDLK